MARIKLYALVGAAFVLALLMYRGMIRRDVLEKVEAARDQAYRETRERIDEVEDGGDAGVLRDWLRERGRKPDGDL